jgi:TP901 family phage tail tape measure protein
MADKEVRVKIVADTSDITKKLNDLEKALKDMANTMDKLDSGDGLDKATKSVKEFTDAVELADDEVDELSDSLDKLDNGGDFDKLTKSGKELSDNLEKIGKSAKELDDTLDKLDNNGFDRLNKNTEELREDIKLATDDFKEFNRQQKLVQDTGKENNTIFDKLKNLFSNLSSEATQFGGKLTASFDKGKTSILQMVEAFSSMQTASKINTARIEELNSSINKGEKHLADLKSQYEKVTQALKDAKARAEELDEALKFDRPKEEAEKYEKQLERVKQGIEKLGKHQQNLETVMNGTTKQIDNQKKALKDLGGTTEETAEGLKKVGKSLKDALSSLDEGDFGGVLDGLKDTLSGLFQAIPTNAKVLIAVFTGLGKAIKECAEQGVNQLQKGLNTLGTVFGKISSVAKSFGQEIKNAFENITGFELDLSSMIETVVDFEDTMMRAGAICGATGEDYEKLEGLARKLGATTRYSASEVAQAMAEMGQQGYSLEEIMSSVDAVLNLATVGNLDLARSSEIVTNTLNAFGMESTEASRVVDILAQASVSSGTSVEQLGQALENCASTSGALGIEIEDVATAIGLMGDNFIKSGKAGTSLNTFMANMSKPTKQMVQCLQEYNLEGARQKILNGDLIGGYKEFAEKMANLTTEQKTQIATTLAGKEGMSGFLSIVNSGVKGIEELEKAIKNSNDVAKHMAETFDNTLKGALLSLSSAIQERLLQVMDKIKPMVKGVIDVLTEFFNIWNGMSDKVLGGGFAKAIEYLEKQSREWGKAIEKGLSDIIKKIDNFANSKAFDNLLQVGTNIINGICNGINRAKENGTLDSAIRGIITKVVNWVGDNLPTIIQAGKQIIDGIVKGIQENADSISNIITEVIQMQTDIDSSINYAKWKVIGENMGTFITEGIKSILTPFFAGLGGLLEGLGNVSDQYDKQNHHNGTIFDKIFPKKEDVEQKGYETGQSYVDGTGKGVTAKKEDLGNTVNQNFKDAKPKTDQTATEIGTGISENIMSKLETMDTDDLKALGLELQNLQQTSSTVSQAIGQSFVDIRNSARTEITGMVDIFRNQFTAMTNIVRNQMVNVANIMKNQATNMANNIRTSFTAISNIIKNQMTNTANTIRTEMTNCANIMKNQTTNMANNIRTSFTAISNIIKNQMTNIANAIRSEMTNCANIMKNQAVNMANNIRTEFTNIASIIRNQMTNVANSIRSEMTNCSNIIKNQTTNMANTFRSSFTNLSNIAKSQMTNIANAIRSEMTNCSNIIKNQVTNMTNSFRSSFTNLANIAKNQTKNVSDAIRSNAVNWANIISNQSANARNALTRQFMSMHSVVRTQMANCLSTVRSYMSQIASATNRTMTMNFKVNKTVTTTNVTKNVTKGLDPISTMDSMNTNIRSINPSTMASGLIGGDINFNLNGGASGNLALEIPLYIDGREIARATATYSQEELKKLTKRSDRRRGE